MNKLSKELHRRLVKGVELRPDAVEDNATIMKALLRAPFAKGYNAETLGRAMMRTLKAERAGRNV